MDNTTEYYWRDRSMIPDEYKVYAYSLPEEIWDANVDLYGEPITNGTNTYGNPLRKNIWTFLLKCPHCGTLKIGRSTGFWTDRTHCDKCNKKYGVHSEIKNLKTEA